MACASSNIWHPWKCWECEGTVKSPSIWPTQSKQSVLTHWRFRRFSGELPLKGWIRLQVFGRNCIATWQNQSSSLYSKSICELWIFTSPYFSCLVLFDLFISFISFCFFKCRLPHEWCRPSLDGDVMMKTDKTLPRYVNSLLLAYFHSLPFTFVLSCIQHSKVFFFVQWHLVL